MWNRTKSVFGKFFSHIFVLIKKKNNNKNVNFIINPKPVDRPRWQQLYVYKLCTCQCEAAGRKKNIITVLAMIHGCRIAYIILLSCVLDSADCY